MDAEDMKRVWKKGSYEDEATHYLPVAAHLVGSVGVGDGDEVLDIGCGTGNAAVTAARRGAEVTGVDITPEMLEYGRENAEIANVEGIEWREGDATDIPLEDDGYDVTLSCLGHMYGDPPDETTRELIRVTRSGGRVGFTSWTATSLYPSMAGVVSTFVAEEDLPDYSEPPFMWGSETTVEDRLSSCSVAEVEEVEFETATVEYPTLSPEHFWHRTSRTSGVFGEVLEAIDEDELPELNDRMAGTVERYFNGSRNVVELEYLLTTATVV